MPDLRRLWRWRPRRALVADALAEARGGRVNQIAHPKVAHVGLDGVQAVGNQRQECGRVVGIDGCELRVVCHHDEEAETKGENEENFADEPNVLHARTFPCYPVGCLWC